VGAVLLAYAPRAIITVNKERLFTSAMLAENIARIQTIIAQACDKAARPRDSVTLVAVCKTQPVTALLDAVAAGIRHFGENRVEEANPKLLEVAASVPDGLTWHMIGHIQSRKAKDVVSYQGVRRFSLVHGVDDLEIATRLSRLVIERGDAPLPILAQVNVSGEATKSGFEAAGWEEHATIAQHITAQIKTLAALPGVSVRGLMTIAPISSQMEDSRPVFRSLKLLRDHLQDALGVALPDLSMGMTDDYPIAIEEGATLVRVGRAIFGER